MYYEQQDSGHDVVVKVWFSHAHAINGYPPVAKFCAQFSRYQERYTTVVQISPETQAEQERILQCADTAKEAIASAASWFVSYTTHKLSELHIQLVEKGIDE